MAIEPLPPDHRTAAIEHLAALLTSDVIDLDAFEALKNGVLAAVTADDLALVLSHAPSPVRMTPPSRRLSEPLVIESRSGAIKLTSTWQLAEETHIKTGSGAVSVDLSSAEFDGPEIDLDVEIGSGALRIVVPHGVAVQLVSTTIGSGALSNKLGEVPALPGMPVVRLRISVGSGSVALRRPRAPRWRRRRRWYLLWLR